MGSHRHSSFRSPASAAPRRWQQAACGLALALLLSAAGPASAAPSAAASPAPARVSTLGEARLTHEQTALQETEAGAAAATRPSASGEPESGDGVRRYWESVIGSCASGAFAGAVSAATGTAPVAATVIGVPAVASVVIVAAGSGCFMGVATASVSAGSILGWHKLVWATSR